MQGRQHHVGGVEGVDEVGREAVLVLRPANLLHRHLGGGELVEVLYIHADATDTLLLGHQVGVGLNNWQPERGDPGDVLPTASDHVSALCQPILDLLRSFKKHIETLKCLGCEVFRRGIKVAGELLNVLKLLGDLLGGAVHGDPIHGGHHRPLDHLPPDDPLQVLGNLMACRTVLCPLLLHNGGNLAVHISWKF